jgi:DNA-binding CsgD family transcriptional regulator/PAS domain-containing protein
MAYAHSGTIGSLLRGESVGFDQLLLALYGSVHAPAPWGVFLELLCKHFEACTATLVLRQPSRGDRGVLFDVNTRRSVVEVYRTQVFPDDPFRDLEEGVACNIFDRVSRENFQRSRFHNELLRLDGICDILALNVTFGNTYLGSLKLGRREPSGSFGAAEKLLLMRLYPHLKVAMEAYERSHRQDLESNAYVRAIDQLAFGVIILNERGHVIRVNETAARIMQESQLLRVSGNELLATEAAHQELLAQALRALPAAAEAGAAATSPLKLSASRCAPGKPVSCLHLLMKSITPPDGGSGPGVAIFLSDHNLHRNVAIEPFARLYQISRAEMALVTELLEGASITQAAEGLQISENTARAQLRSVFTKTGTHRQTELTRLVLTSLAIIA